MVSVPPPRSWKDCVKGVIVVFYLRRYAVFLCMEGEAGVCGALALRFTFEELTGVELSLMARAVLLSFNGRIVQEALIVTRNVISSANLRKGFDRSYKGQGLALTGRYGSGRSESK